MSLEDRLYPLLTRYQAMPQPLRRAAGAVYRRLPARWRWGAHYDEFKRLLAASRSWSSVELEQYQVEQLRRVLEHAQQFCPFYAERFRAAGWDIRQVRRADDLRRCPLLEKADLQRHREAIASRDFAKRCRLYVTTGGSTGVPVGFYLHRGISRPKEQAFLEEMWERAGYAPGARLAVIRGQAISGRARGGLSFHDTARDWLVLSSYHLTAERLPEYLEAIERFRPDFLHAYPSAALQLAEFLERSGQRWRTPLRGILCGSERLTTPQRRVLERVFATRVYCWYGHAERVVLAGQGRVSDHFYFFPQYGLVEFGEPTADGLREIIGTSFHNLVMPLIRYRTGDYARLAANPDEADAGGREFPWPAAIEIAGREHEFLVSAAGRRISLTALNMHDATFDHLYAVQFYQERPGHAELRYVPAPDFHSSRLEIIAASIRTKLGDDFEVNFRQVAEVERTAAGKHQWLVSRLAETPPPGSPALPLAGSSSERRVVPVLPR